MIDQTAPGPAAAFRSAVAYIVRNFISQQQQQRRARATTRDRLADQMRGAGAGELLHTRFSEVIRVFTSRTQTMRFVAMLKIMEFAKQLHEREVLVREYKNSTDRQERDVLEVVMDSLQLGGGVEHGPVPVVERPQVGGGAVARATVFLNDRGERIAAVTGEMRRIIIQGSTGFAPEVPDALLVEETYAFLGADENKGLGGWGVFQETMTMNPCFFQLVRIAVVTCIMNWYSISVADPCFDACEEDNKKA
ncbi:hypothetical protein P167DRAFT_532708 [Morchella conica CCBAS932]|uniref:Uncharacterized protein n=1 Tax=Morchella conica CCBAS932 TaxID=1392247 RepID=A0A3N4KYW8_9PEZI|nr:hypothetical protein P167DRAFT_532708 [Morchella conica CCBAS932]